MRFRDRTILLIAPEIVNPRSMPCVGLGYIGAYLEREGLEVRIVDAQFTKEDPAPVLRDTAPTLVAIGVDSRTIERGLALAETAKGYGHTVLLGGLHVSLIKGEILNHPQVDYGIVGDGEVSTLHLLEVLDGTRAPRDASGLVWRDAEGRAKVNPNTTEIQSLDSLPFPDYRLAGIDDFPLYPLVTSRDCPYKCIYCTVGSISHGRFRFRSAESCVDEIIAAKERYGIRGFLIVDENFAANKKRALEFCRLLIEKEVNLPWSAFEGIRADSLDDNFLTLLKQSQCQWVFFGIETAENAVLKTIKKGSKFRRIEDSVALARSYGLNVGGFLIVGLPDSDFGKDMATVDWAVRNLDRCQFWISIPYYGTPMYEWVKQNGTLLREPIGDNLVNSLSTWPFYETERYREEDVKRAHAIASLRTGVDFFYDFLDQTSGSPLETAYRRVPAYQKRFLDFAQTWAPHLTDTLKAGLPEPMNALDGVFPTPNTPKVNQPLTPDFTQGRSTPTPAAEALVPDLDGAP